MQQRISSVLFRTGWGCLRAIPAWVLVFCSGGFAQAPNPTFRVDVDLTLIDVQVVDTATGQPIRNLRRSDFVVLADGQPRDIAVFEPENTPLDLAVVLDLSGIQPTLRVAGRVIGRPDPVRLGLIRMLDDLSLQDRMAVVSFSSRPHLVSGLTSDRVSLRDALGDAMNERMRVRKRTAAVRGAVAFASRVFDGQPRIGRRRAVLLITHNRSTDDDVDGSAAIAPLRGADAVLTALVVPQFFSTPHMHSSIGILGREIATWPPRGNKEIEELPEQGAVDPVVEATAGEIFRGALNVFWATALDRLRSRYRIGFYEPDAGRRGRARTVQVILTGEALRLSPDAVVRVPRP